MKNASSELPILGHWKIVHYQIVGYTEMSETHAKNWVDKRIELTPQTVTLHDGAGSSTCSNFNYQVSTENTESYFLIGYHIKPDSIGITENEIQRVTLESQTDSWLGKHREFIKVSDEAMIANFDGVFLFLDKTT